MLTCLASVIRKVISGQMEKVEVENGNGKWKWKRKWKWTWKMERVVSRAAGMRTRSLKAWGLHARTLEKTETNMYK